MSDFRQDLVFCAGVANPLEAVLPDQPFEYRIAAIYGSIGMPTTKRAFVYVRVSSADRTIAIFTSALGTSASTSGDTFDITLSPDIPLASVSFGFHYRIFLLGSLPRDLWIKPGMLVELFYEVDDTPISGTIMPFTVTIQRAW